MIRSFVAHVNAVTGVGESTSLSVWVPSLLVTTIVEPPLPSSTALARYRPPLGENAAALGGSGPSWVGAPERGNSTSDPGTSGVCVIRTSGGAVGLAVGVAPAGVTVGLWEVVADAVSRPRVLTSEPSGA